MKLVWMEIPTLIDKDKNMKHIFISFLFIISFPLAGSLDYYPYNIGLIGGKYMAGSNYNDTNVLGISAEYLFSNSIAVGIDHRNFVVQPGEELSLIDEYDVGLTSLYFSKYKHIEKYTKEDISIITSIGAASLTIENTDKIYIMMGIGVRISPADKLFIDFSIKDYMKEFSIPFTSFPDVNIYAAGGGEHYVHLNLGIHLRFGESRY